MKEIILTYLNVGEINGKYYDYDNTFDFIRGLIQLYVESRGGSGTDNDIVRLSSAELCAFIDSKEDMYCFVFDMPKQSYVRQDRNWIKNCLLQVLHYQVNRRISSKSAAKINSHKVTVDNSKETTALNQETEGEASHARALNQDIDVEEASQATALNQDIDVEEASQAAALNQAIDREEASQAAALNQANGVEEVNFTDLSIKVYEHDLRCLEPGEEINDRVMDSYLNHVLHNVVPPEFRGRTYIFDSYFNGYVMTTFNYEEPDMDPNSMLSKSIQRWSRKVNIFEKDFVFIPVYRNRHWYLIILCYLSQLRSIGETENSGESSTSISGRSRHPYSQKGRPRVLILDCWVLQSLTDTGKVYHCLSNFLEMMWLTNHPRKYDASLLTWHKPVPPQQYDLRESGVYVAQYVESFFENPISLQTIPNNLESWFPRSLIENKRLRMKDVMSRRVQALPDCDSSDSDIVAL